MSEESNGRPGLFDRAMEVEDYETLIEAVESEFGVRNRTLKPKVAEFYCDPCSDAEPRFDRLLEDLSETDLVPTMSSEGGELVVRAGKSKGAKGDQRTFTRKHLLLFSATIVTTLWIGASMFKVDLLSNPFAILRGWPYTLAIMGILGVHESGHYLMSKRREVVATPPYFIPLPFALGTLGAVIRMKSPMPDRKSMFDIGVAGPLLGLAIAVPVTVIGLIKSPLLPPSAASEARWALGEPVIYWALTELVSPGRGILHPVAFAGWVGFFVTFLNLLPVGQLDGGHISRALLGDLHHRISRIIPIILLSLGFFLTFSLEANGTVWIFWGFLGLLFHGGGHPPPLNDVTPLDLKRKLVGCLTFALMLACFVPIPFQPV